MAKSGRPTPIEDQVAKNPSVDPKIVKEALRMRKELENMGVWEESTSRVRNPFEINPDLKQRGKRLIVQDP